MDAVVKAVPVQKIFVTIMSIIPHRILITKITPKRNEK